MPPITKAGGQQFRKDVAFVAKDEDDDQQIAAGIVMVPDKADLQNDFAREDTIRGFADQFETFVEAGEASGGVMHAVWPDDWMALERNEVLDEAETIGTQTVDAGAWVQEWRINNADLWGLIDDGILAGYSIGAIQVGWHGPHDPEELDDVTVPDELGEDALVWELTDAIIREVSAVDIPAVPDAQILEAKALEKRLGDYLGDPDGFVEEALERGHTEQEAGRLWEVLVDAVDAEGSADPGKQSLFERIGKAAVNALKGGGDRTGVQSHVAETPTDGPRSKTLTLTLTKEDTVGVDVFRVVASADDDTDYDGDLLGMGVDMPEHDVYVDWRRAAFPDELAEAHVSIYGSIDDLEQATGNVIESLDTVTSPTDGLADVAQQVYGRAAVAADASPREYAAGSDTPDDNGSTDAARDMSDTDDNTTPDDPFSDAPKWAAELRDQQEENSKRLDEQNDRLEAALDGGEEKTAQVEVGGEVYEVTESEAKAWFESDVAGTGDDPMADAPDHLKALSERVEAVDERLDTIVRQSGHSQQLERAAEDVDDDTGLEGLGKALS